MEAHGELDPAGKDKVFRDYLKAAREFLCNAQRMSNPRGQQYEELNDLIATIESMLGIQ